MKSVRMSWLTALALATLVALAPTASAQETKDNQESPKPQKPSAGQQRQRRGGGPGGAAQLDRIAAQLKLTEEQKGKLQPLLKEEQTKLRELRTDTALSNEQRREKARQIREQSLAAMKPILSAEQMDEFKKMRQPGAQGPRGPRSNGNPPPSREKKPENSAKPEKP